MSCISYHVKNGFVLLKQLVLAQQAFESGRF